MESSIALVLVHLLRTFASSTQLRRTLYPAATKDIPCQPYTRLVRHDRSASTPVKLTIVREIFFSKWRYSLVTLVSDGKELSLKTQGRE